jgi:hypothetical protein
MRSMLSDLYREYSKRQGISPDQSHALACAATVLGSTGIPGSMLREAANQLQAAFG